MMRMEKHEKWILGVIVTSLLCAIVELGLSLGDGELGSYSIWTAPVAACLTLIFHCVTLPLWRNATKKHRPTSPNTPFFIYSVTTCVLSSLLAAFWLAVTCMLFVFVTLAYTYLQEEKNVVPWVEAAFSVANMALMWAEFGLVVHYRQQFFKRRQETFNLSLRQSGVELQPILNPTTTKKLEKYTRLILWTILVSLCLAIAEVGISLKDGWIGGYSLWLALSAAVLTIVLHLVTLPVWKYTAEARKGTQKPPFIYSLTICVLTGLLAAFWAVSTGLAFWYTTTVETSPDMAMHYGRVHIIPWIEALLALVLSGLIFIEHLLVRGSREYLLQQVKVAQNDVSLIQRTTAAAPVSEA
ncbi:hypothetical protein FS842_001767 [Serendipita sp. 407]|nr:hypothetical protein FS842_001767 [Serendipita sp. 407]